MPHSFHINSVIPYHVITIFFLLIDSSKKKKIVLCQQSEKKNVLNDFMTPNVTSSLQNW